jgi:hypothetical protein
MLADGAVSDFGMAFQGEAEEESDIELPDSTALEAAPSTGLAPISKRPAAAIAAAGAAKKQKGEPQAPAETPAQKKQRVTAEADAAAKKAEDSLLLSGVIKPTHRLLEAMPLHGKTRRRLSDF